MKSRVFTLLIMGSLAVAYCLASLAETPTASSSSEQFDSLERDYASDLPRIPATPPTEALAQLKVEPGFRVELAAAEPLVTDPVALEFDEFGRMFVVEMGGYSEHPEAKAGVIRRLEDADQDGRFEKMDVFAEGFEWPTAVFCYDGGLFVADAPNIYFLKDADGDGLATQPAERRVVFTGFGRNNVQGLMNSFRWGLDDRIHLAVSSCGAAVRRPEEPDTEALILRGRNFSFDPRTFEYRAESGASQHGMCFDAFGRQYTCSNSNHIQQVMLPDRHLARNAFIQPPVVAPCIAAEGPAADVYRISPVEPWRVIRTRLRKKGIVPGMLEGGGRDSGYFTSATGVTIYTGDAWPAQYRGNAFIGDVGSNLVHRKTVEAQGDAAPLLAKRATPESEFIASPDNWFRPVQYANAPDGNLYVLDMYREVIEHPSSLPPILKQHLDLTSGSDKGRLYRVVRDEATPDAERAMFSRDLPGGATTEELVAMLSHPNGWHRTTAARLLYERQDPATLGLIAQSLPDVESPEARVQMLYALDTAGGVDGRTLAAAMKDPDARMRAAVVRLAGDWLASKPSADAIEVQAAEAAIIAAAADAAMEVRYQAALALGDVTDDGRYNALAALAERDLRDQYMRAAILCSLPHGADAVLSALAAQAEFAAHPEGRAFLLELARQIGARHDEEEVKGAAAAVVSQYPEDESPHEELLVAMLRGAGARGAELRAMLSAATGGAADRLIETLYKRSLETTLNDEVPLPRRVEAVASLALGSYDHASEGLAELLEPQQPQELQLAAIGVLGQYTEAAVAEPLLAAWPAMSPAIRQQALQVLLARPATASALLQAVTDKTVNVNDLDPATVQRLKTHPNAKVAALAAAAFGQSSARAAIVDSFAPALQLKGDVDRGRTYFRANCATCHRREGFGTEVGADLATVLGRPPEFLVMSILDPNREVDPKYLQYSVLTVDGKATSGIIASETASSVTLTRADNVSESIAREDIESLQSTGLSLMPEGFEKVFDIQAMADLVAYLRMEQ